MNACYFRKEDFENPETSVIFGALERVSDDRLRSAAVLFRSLLDLAPQECALSRGTSPSFARIHSQSFIGQQLISDHVSSYRKQMRRGLARLPNLNRLHPGYMTSFRRAFEKASSEHSKTPCFQNVWLWPLLYLPVSLVTASAYLKLTSAVALVLTPLLILLANYAFWYYQFRLEPALSALKAVDSELRTIVVKIDLVRTIIKSKQLARNPFMSVTHSTE